MDPQRCKEAQVNFRKAGVEKYVELKECDARTIVPTIAKRNPRSFDLVFLDVGDKAVYVELLKPCIEALRAGGFLIADNTLWGWPTAATTEKRHQTITTISKFHQSIFSDRRLDAVIIPLRTADSLPYGFTVCRKKRD